MVCAAARDIGALFTAAARHPWCFTPLYRKTKTRSPFAYALVSPGLCGLAPEDCSSRVLHVVQRELVERNHNTCFRSTQGGDDNKVEISFSDKSGR